MTPANDSTISRTTFGQTPDVFDCLRFVDTAFGQHQLLNRVTAAKHPAECRFRYRYEPHVRWVMQRAHLLQRVEELLCARRAAIVVRR